jgi:23S rRNA (adenine2503-C2)-methyltransferase
MLQDLLSMDEKQISDEFNEMGYKSYRSGQIYKWLHSGADSFEKMTNIPATMKNELAEKYFISSCDIEKKQVSKADGTVKYLFKLHDGEFIESVVMNYHHGYSICISSQVGCNMKCAFCATGQGGFTRNLLAGEMLAQILSAQRDMGIRISNVVVMGMGEPLNNYDALIKFLNLVSSENGLNIGMRHISVSTCGIVDKIYELADLRKQLTLSISLHAPNDEIRQKLMPVERKWKIQDLIKACHYYSDTTGRRISFEYIMINNVNDSDACAEELSRLLRGIISHINLIPVNSVTGAGLKPSSTERIYAFQKKLEQNGYTATVRRTLGSDIDASCGQLRGKKL